jgi:hypothetical protein
MEDKKVLDVNKDMHEIENAKVTIESEEVANAVDRASDVFCDDALSSAGKGIACC